MTTATFWQQKPGGTRYWRVDIPAKHLPAQALSLHRTDLTLQDSVDRFGVVQARERVCFPRHEGAAIWQIPGNVTRSLIMAEMQSQGIRVIVEVDDNYLVKPIEIPNSRSPWLYKAAVNDSDDRSSVEVHRNLIPWVDGVICSTPYLAKTYSRINPNVYVCRNSVDTDDWADVVKPGDGIFRIGYAGSKSHYHDYNLVQRTLSWAEDQPRVEVVVMGVKRSTPKAKHFEWTDDLAQYRRNLGQIDVGLCPLRSSAFADCKSDVKVLEYSMAGALSIVSKVEAYRPWWDGPCLVAETETDFRKHVKWCVKNRDEVKRIAAEAKAHVLATRDIRQTITCWREAVSG